MLKRTKYSALVYLAALSALILFLSYQPVDDEVRDVVIMIIGALTASACSALPRILGNDEVIGYIEADIKDLQEQCNSIKLQIERTNNIDKDTK